MRPPSGPSVGDPDDVGAPLLPEVLHFCIQGAISSTNARFVSAAKDAHSNLALYRFFMRSTCSSKIAFFPGVPRKSTRRQASSPA